VIRGLINVLRFLFLLFVVRLVVRTLARAFSAGSTPPRASAPPGRPPMRPVEDLVLDRVCRTHVPRSRALTASVAGREEHFCSPACRDKALAAVARAS
jgi:hypothetical protein